MTVPRPAPSYSDRFDHSAGGGPPVPSRTGTATSLTSTTGAFEPWFSAEDFTKAVPLPLSAAGSTVCSPAQSARGAKRRVMSSSTLSSDVQSDVISLIRYSPTEIPLFDGRPTSSSTQFGQLGPGSISHLSARSIIPASSARAQQQQQQLCDVMKPFYILIAPLYQATYYCQSYNSVCMFVCLLKIAPHQTGGRLHPAGFFGGGVYAPG